MFRLLFILIACFVFSCTSRNFSYRQVPDAEPYVSDGRDSIILIAPGDHYKANILHKALFGRHYRSTWTEPAEFPVLDLSKELGGLTPIKKGGSFQTMNLRLFTPDSQQYVFRSIDKDPSKALPKKVQKRLLGRTFRDQTTTSFPYGALIASSLAEEAGIFHTNPEIVYIPHDSTALGPFYHDFSGTLVLLEERPDENWENNASFGYSKNLTGSEKMLKNISREQRAYVDQQAFLKARMLDMIIGDWSRREDQWRWAEFDHGDSLVLLPVPRDRDHAFFRFRDGLFPFIGTFARPQLHHFSRNIHHISGLNRAGRRLDDVLLNELEASDWARVAESIYSDLDDEAIHDAVAAMPKNVYALEGARFEKRLKSRRDQIYSASMRYYDMLSREVTIQGTDQDESFLVSPVGADSIRVQVRSRESEKVIYERQFDVRKTRKITLLGLGGDDVFADGSRLGRLPEIIWLSGEEPGMQEISEENEKVRNSETWLERFIFD